MRIEYHRTLIADRVRNNAFYNALKAVIKPGESVVADIGAGTGLLGLMAAKLGARAVYLYECAPVADVAGEILEQNHAEQCQLFPCHSTEMLDPPPVDVIVCETLGNYAFEEAIIATLNDACSRMLKPGGTVLPSRVRQYAEAVVSPRFFYELTVWDNVGFEINMTAAKLRSLNNIYVRTVQAEDLRGGMGDVPFEEREWDCVDLAQENSSRRNGTLQFAFDNPADVFGVAVWWEADLIPGISLSTSPDQPKTHWEQLYFPVEAPIHVKAGEMIDAQICSQTSEQDGTLVSWTIAHVGSNGEVVSRQSMDLEKGYID